jgi:hypothetical protein
MPSNTLLPAATRAALLASLVGVAALAHADDDDVRWDADGAATRHAVVAPGRLVEWCSPLQRGEKVRWQFDAAAALDFNVHYHEGRTVQFPAKQDAVAKAQGTLDPPVDHDYCWMWTNPSSSPVDLSASLAKAP